MMRTLKLIARGCGRLPRYGHHPGTAWVLACLVGGALAGGYVGVAWMALLCGPLYLMGAYERARDSERERSGETGEGKERT